MMVVVSADDWYMYMCDRPLCAVDSSGLAESVAGARSDSFLFLQCQLIVCQMSSTRCQPLNWMLLPIAAVLFVVVSGFAPNSETLLLYLLTAFLTLAHIHYGVVVVGELSTWASGLAAVLWLQGLLGCCCCLGRRILRLKMGVSVGMALCVVLSVAV